jgi:hypothetical protein
MDLIAVLRGGANAAREGEIAERRRPVRRPRRERAKGPIRTRYGRGVDAKTRGARQVTVRGPGSRTM